MNKTAKVLLVLALWSAFPAAARAGHWRWLTTPVRVPFNVLTAPLPKTGQRFNKCAQEAADGTTLIVSRAAFKRDPVHACEELAFPFVATRGAKKLARLPSGGGKFKAKLDSNLDGETRTGKVRR